MILLVNGGQLEVKGLILLLNLECGLLKNILNNCFSDPVWASINFCVCVCAKCIGKSLLTSSAK